MQTISPDKLDHYLLYQYIQKYIFKGMRIPRAEQNQW